MDALTSLIVAQIEGTKPTVLLDCVTQFLRGVVQGHKGEVDGFVVDNPYLSLVSERNTSCHCHPEYEKVYAFITDGIFEQAVKEVCSPQVHIDGGGSIDSWFYELGQRVGALTTPVG